MVFMFDRNRPVEVEGVQPRPFRLVMVAGAQLLKTVWKFAGRSEPARLKPLLRAEDVAATATEGRMMRDSRT